jgi:hypothetical protein
MIQKLKMSMQETEKLVERRASDRVGPCSTHETAEEVVQGVEKERAVVLDGEGLPLRQKRTRTRRAARRQSVH